MRKLLLLTAVGVLMLVVSPCWAGIPHLINYQGMLTDNGGNPLSGSFDLTFSIYSVSADGSALWTETHSGVLMENGLFNVILGSGTTPIPSFVFEGVERYLGIKVGTDDELTPRIQLTSVGYAYRAERTDTADYSLEAQRADTADYSLEAKKADTASYAIEVITAQSDGDWTISDDDMYSAVSGNVGIGTTSPAQKLHVNGHIKASYFHGDILQDGGTSQSLQLKANGGMSFTADANNDDAGGVFRFYNNGAGDANMRMIITEDGDVGIGTTDPDVDLDVYGTQSISHISDGIVNIGSTSGYHVTLDNNEIHGRNASTYSNLYINFFGGDVLMAQQGNVGIGTVNPAQELHVNGDIRLSDGGDIEFKDSNTRISQAGTDLHVTADNNLYLHPDHDIYIRKDEGSSWVRFDNDMERVGIGTTTPTTALDVDGMVKCDRLGINTVPDQFDLQVNGLVYIDGWLTTTGDLDAYSNVYFSGLTASAGTDIVISSDRLYKKSSSIRYKENIRKLQMDPEEIFQLQPVRFDWKTTGVEDIGLIAEEVDEVIPDLVIYDSEGKPDAVKYDRIAIYLLEIVKEQQEKISALEKEMAELRD